MSLMIGAQEQKKKLAAEMDRVDVQGASVT